MVFQMEFINDMTVILLLLIAVSRSDTTNVDKVCDCEKFRRENSREGLQNEPNICINHCRATNVRENNVLSGINGDLKTDTSEQGDPRKAYCIDTITGKRHLAASQWLNGCVVMTCRTDGYVSSEKVHCPSTCVSEKDDRSKCCKICKRKLHCTPKEIRLEVPKPMLGSISMNKLYLSDVKCRPTLNDTHAIFRTGLTTCGTKMEETNMGIRYSNLVVKSYFRNIVVRPLFKFSCYFGVRKFDVGSENAATIKATRPDENIRIKMVYTDSNGNILVNNPMSTEALEGMQVFVSISTDRILTNGRFLVVENCELISLNRIKSHSLIHEGCPSEPTLKILETQPEKLWFSFQAKRLPKTNSQYQGWFQYSGKRFHPKDREYVDLTCQAAVCTATSRSNICNRHCIT